MLINRAVLGDIEVLADWSDMFTRSTFRVSLLVARAPLSSALDLLSQ